MRRSPLAHCLPIGRAGEHLGHRTRHLFIPVTGLTLLQSRTAHTEAGGLSEGPQVELAPTEHVAEVEQFPFRGRQQRGKARIQPGPCYCQIAHNRHRTREEGRCRRSVAGRTDVHVDHLAEILEGPKDLAGNPGNFDVRLVNTPGASDTVPMGACCFLVERGEAPHPVEDGQGVDTHPALGAIGVGQPLVEVPPDREGDDRVREAQPGKGGQGAVGLAASTAATGRTLAAFPIPTSLAPLLAPGPDALRAPTLSLNPAQPPAYPTSAEPNKTPPTTAGLTPCYSLFL